MHDAQRADKYHQRRVKLNHQRELFCFGKKSAAFFIVRIKSQLVDSERSQNEAICAINERPSET